MLRVFVLAGACALAGTGAFGTLAAEVGLAGYGDHLAALFIAWLVTPFVAGEH
jgi:hypothetical protein